MLLQCGYLCAETQAQLLQRQPGPSSLGCLIHVSHTLQSIISRQQPIDHSCYYDVQCKYPAGKSQPDCGINRL